MLKELFDLVKGHASDTVINNPDIPNDKNNDVVAEATNTVASGLRNVVAGGGLENIISLFKGDRNKEENSSVGNLLKNPIVIMMVGHLAGKLINKYNIGGSQANKVASGLIPGVLGGLISNANSGRDGFSLDGLLNSITGGQVAQQEQSGGINLQDIIGNFTGSGSGDNNAGGGLMDLVTKFAEGARSQQQKNGGGGLMDLIKGFM